MLYLKIPSLPPSVNHAYFNIPSGGRVLTKEGKKYKAEATAHLTQTYPAELARVKPNQPYSVLYVLGIPALLNKGYPDKAKTRYKRIDASNRVKLLEDVLADVMGLDDSNNMNVLASKVLAEADMTEVWIFGDEPGEHDPIRSLIEGIRGPQPH